MRVLLTRNTRACRILLSTTDGRRAVVIPTVALKAVGRTLFMGAVSQRFQASLGSPLESDHIIDLEKQLLVLSCGVFANGACSTRLFDFDLLCPLLLRSRFNIPRFAATNKARTCAIHLEFVGGNYVVKLHHTFVS